MNNFGTLKWWTNFHLVSLQWLGTSGCNECFSNSYIKTNIRYISL